MIGFLKSLFGFTDRATVAAERAATAMEGIADDLEAVRANVRKAFSLDAQQVPPVAIGHDDTDDAAAVNGNGRKRIKSR